MKLLVTGGAGFIGSHFVGAFLRERRDGRVVNLDALTYAGKLENLEGLPADRHRFVKGDIGDAGLVAELFRENGFDAVVNFAAESHVDRSILGPRVFIETNVAGTVNLLECAHAHWKAAGAVAKRRFVQISTDEVYGSLAENAPAERFRETSALAPSSPYSASKAAADLTALAYHKTFGLGACITRCSNNYGPRQDPEKLLPLVITRALADGRCPVYGDGGNVRDWLHVEDHCAAVLAVLERGRPGEVYNIGASNEWRNIDLVKRVLALMGKPESLIERVKDRAGHDRRYAVDASKIRAELGWAPKIAFEEGLRQTVQWYASRHPSREAKHAS
jgi:dTDP-glucose 4,6-dehydratase